LGSGVKAAKAGNSFKSPDLSECDGHDLKYQS
jgi:hypothetical protein